MKVQTILDTLKMQINFLEANIRFLIHKKFLYPHFKLSF